MKFSPLYFAFFLFLLPVITFAQEYKNLISIPGINGEEVSGFGGYINALYIFAISVAAILAVIKIIIGGVKYMLSDIVTNKSDAKNEIKGALIGLLLIISAVLVLDVINPDIKKNQVNFSEIKSFDPDATGIAASKTLAESMPDCVTSVEPKPSASGKSTVASINVSGCDTETQKLAFKKFKGECVAKGGTTGIDSTGKSVGCSIPISNTGTKEADGLAADLAYLGATITKEGNVVTLDFYKACTDKYQSDPDLSATKKAQSIADCKSSTFTNNAKVQAAAKCGDLYGKYNTGDGTLSCELPKVKIAGDTLKYLDPNPNIGERQPITWDELKKACGNGTLYKSGGIAPIYLDYDIDPGDYTCVKY